MPFSRESSELFDRPSINLGRIVGRRRAEQGARRLRHGRRHPLPARPGPRRDPRADPRRSRTSTSRARSSAPPAHVVAHEPVRARALRDAARRIDDGESMSVGRDGASDAVAFLEAGVPAVEFGPVGGGHHGPEEWVSIASLRALPPGARATSRARCPARLARERRRRRRCGVEGGLRVSAATRPARRGCGMLVARVPARRAARSSLLTGDRGRDRRSCSRSTTSSTPIQHTGTRRSTIPERRPRADAGEPADDPDARLRQALRRQDAQGPSRARTRSCSCASTRDANAIAVHVDPARPEGRRSPATAPDKINAAYDDRRPALTVATIKRCSRTLPASLPDQPRRQRQLRRLPARGRLRRLRLRRRRPPLLQRQHRRRAGDSYATINVQPGYQKLMRPGRARLRPLPPHATTTSSAPRASRTSCARPSSRRRPAAARRRQPQASSPQIFGRYFADRHRCTTTGDLLACCGSGFPGAARADQRGPLPGYEREPARSTVRLLPPRSCARRRRRVHERAGADEPARQAREPRQGAQAARPSAQAAAAPSGLDRRAETRARTRR